MSKSRQFALITSIVWCSAIVFIAFIFNLGNTGLIDETEPLFAEAARIMTVTGDWITPYYNEATRFDKPPLVYWGMAIGYKLIGVNEWAVRLPSAIGAIALTFFSFFTVSHFRQKRPWILPFIVSFNLQTLIWARTGVSDMLLSGCMGSALFCFFWGYTQEKQPQNLWQFPSPWYLAFYILLALAVLTKGPVGIVLPGLIILAFLIYLGQLKTVIQQMGVVWGGVIFLTLSIPWYILVTIRNGQEYIDSFFGYHNLERFTSVVNKHSAPWYFYFLILLILFIPWSLYLPQAIGKTQFWRLRFWRRQPRKEQLAIFAFFWLVTIFVFFSIAVTKLPSYILPLIPAAAILVTLYWQEIKPNKFLLISILLNILFLMILAVFFLYSPQVIGEDPAVVDLPGTIAESGLPVRGAIIWGVTAVVMAILAFKQKYWPGIIWVNLCGFLLFFLFVMTPAIFLVDQVRQLPLRELAILAKEVQKPEEEMVMIGFEKPSLVFYSRTHINFFRVESKFKNYIKASLKESNNNDTVLMIARQKRLEEYEIAITSERVIAKRGVYLLLRIQKNELI